MQTTTCATIEIAYYTHLVPIFIAIILSILILKKTKQNLLSKIFFSFTLIFSIWLLLDLVAWTVPNYDVISFAWSLFDYFNIIFFLLGLYFFIVFVFERDIKSQWKFFGFLLTLFPFYRIISGHGIGVFDQQICEIINDGPLILYLKCIEFFVVFIIASLTLEKFLEKEKTEHRSRVVIVGISLLLFFITFAVTDYLSVQTNVYEIGLYGLFVIPLFLGLIVYAIVRYKAFNIEVLSAQAIVCMLILLVGSQFFFIQSTTNRIITLVTFFVAVLFGMSLIKSVMRDIEMQKKLRYANDRLKEIDHTKSRFLSLGTHKILNPVTVIRGYTSLIREGNLGETKPEILQALMIMEQSSIKIEKGIRECLDLSRLSYQEIKEFSVLSLEDVLNKLVAEYQLVLGNNILTSISSLFNVCIKGDDVSLKRAFSAIIENSIKHMSHGVILISSSSDAHVVKIHIVNSRESNIEEDVTAHLATYVAREIIEEHKGTLEIMYDENEKKIHFTVTLPITQKTNTQKAQ